jgi:F-type H+-transporting ATPase subunit gamma
MPSLKEVRNRIVSVNSTQQITKAMKMVAAAKLRRAQDNIIQMRPYAQKLAEMLSTVAQGAEVAQENPLTQPRAVERVLLVVITSDRGLAGAFNANVTKAAMNRIAQQYAGQRARGNVEVLAIGRRGADFFTRRGFTVNTRYVETFTNLSFGTVRGAAEEIMAQFLDGRYDVVELVYNEFKNVATQLIRVEPFLPLVPPQDTPSTVNNDYVFEPSEAEIVNELIPKTLNIKLYKAVLESNASEHGARMTAMDKATENAGELLKELRLVYNRSRQAAITKEILEIVGGAEALGG